MDTSTRSDSAPASAGPSFARRPRWPVALLAAWTAASAVASADTVILSTGDDGEGRMQVEGKVIDWNGREVVIRRTTGRQQTYPAPRVKQVQTDWPDGYEVGQQALAAGDYRRAAELMTDAAQRDDRPWVRRLAMEQLMQCYAAMGDWTTAGRILVELAKSDPHTPALDHAPLAWFAVEGVAPSTVDTWLAADSSPVAQLLGASHAMSTSKRANAMQRLEELRRSDNRRLAFLADAHRWRAEVVTASPDELDRWERRILAAPEAVQAPGWLVLGDARRQQRDYDQAALVSLRAAMLANRQVQLAARALWQAAEALETAGRTDEAQRLARQLVAEYPATPPARQARRMLQSAE